MLLRLQPTEAATASAAVATRGPTMRHFSLMARGSLREARARRPGDISGEGKETRVRRDAPVTGLVVVDVALLLTSSAHVFGSRLRLTSSAHVFGSRPEREMGRRGAESGSGRDDPFHLTMR